VDDLLRATALAEARHFWFRGFRRFVTPLLQQATHGISDARLLDCGCGTGNNLALLSQFGRAYGFDLSDVGLRIGRESGRRFVARGSVVAAPFPGDAFDVVASFDVLYSLDDGDDRTAVLEMHRLARRGGYAIVNVAAMDLLRGDHSILSRERRRYKREQLHALMTQAGFEVVRLTHTNAVLFPPMLVARTIQRIRGLAVEERAQREITVPPAPINAVLTAALQLESYALRFLDSPVGSSLLCLARKS
jgi:SAM-dependent methyltransferase